MASMQNVQKVNSQSSTQFKESELDEQGLPPQHHAGKVGFGPNYDPDPTIGEKITGLKEELEGKIKHDPGLVKHGQDIRSGEEKRKKMTGEDEPNPFQSAADDDKGEGEKSPKHSGPGTPSQGRDTGTTKRCIHEGNDEKER